MYKYLTIILIYLLIAGCSVEPTDKQYTNARTWCDNFGGLKTLSFSNISGLRV